MTESEECVVCLDMGTTRTRAWLLLNGRTVTKRVEDFGVRDRATSSSPLTLEERLRAMLCRITESSCDDASSPTPAYIAAAGMIGSPSGLIHVSHVLAPAGVGELSACVQVVNEAALSKLSIFIVPGVRTTTVTHGIEGIESGDLMRGEESLCIGLLQSGRLRPGDAVLNLGSHWKWILIGEDGRIAKSRTSLTGELIHAVQAHTLLASALPQYRPAQLAADWLEHGARQARLEGLSRALFCVRLLEQETTGTPEERLAYLYGAVLETEITAALRSSFIASVQNILISGAPALAGAWEDRLAKLGWRAATLTEADTEEAYLGGLMAIVNRARSRR